MISCSIDATVLVHGVFEFGFTRGVRQVRQRLVLLHLRLTAYLRMRRQLLLIHQLRVRLLKVVISILEVDGLDVGMLRLSLRWVPSVLSGALTTRSTELV